MYSKHDFKTYLSFLYYSVTSIISVGKLNIKKVSYINLDAAMYDHRQNKSNSIISTLTHCAVLLPAIAIFLFYQILIAKI